MSSELSEVPSTPSVPQLENLGSSEQDELREYLRHMGRSSLYFLTKAILGRQKLTGHLHRQMADFVQTQGPKTLMLVPRGHYKTTIGSEGYPIWRHIDNNDDTCLLGNAVFGNAQKFLRVIKHHCETNQLLRWVFPECHPGKDKWTETELTFDRTVDVKEPSLACIGVGGTAVSLHFACIIKDDLVNEDHIISLEQMEKVIDWHKYSTSLLIRPASDREVVTGTRWAFYDLYSHIMDNEPDFKVFFRQAHDAAGEPIFPEEFSEEVLNAIADRQGPYIYSCQYDNEPSDPTKAIIKPEWIQYIEDIGSPEQLALLFKRCSRFIVLDPALSEERQGDYCGLVVVYVDHEYNMYVDEADQHRIGADGQVDMLMNLALAHEPNAIGIELTSFNQLNVSLERAMDMQKRWFYIQELRPNTHITKTMRIRASLQPLFARRKVFIRRSQRVLRDQLLKFPLGKHDDVIDALGYVPHMWTAGAEPSIYSTYDPAKDPFNMQYILDKLGHGKQPTHRGAYPFILTKEK